MLLNDALRVGGRDVPVPRAFGIDDRNRTARANSEALDLRAVRRTVRTGDVQLLHPVLDVRPGLFALLRSAAIGSAAHEHMTHYLADAKCLSGRFRSGSVF